MRRIIFFVLLVISMTATAQDKPSYFIGLPGQTSHARGNLRVDSTFLNPLRDTTFTPWRLGLQIFRPADSSLYVSTSLTASQKWTRLGSGSVVGDSSIFATRYWTNTQLATKQNSLTTGTTDEYFRGDLSLSNFSSDVTAIGDALYAPISHTHIFSDISDGTDAVRNLFSAGSGITYNPSTGVIAATGSMVYPGAGIPVSTGSAWSTSLTNTTIGTNFLTATNPSAAGYFRTNADNTITHRTYAQVLSDIGATAPQTLQDVTTLGATTTDNLTTGLIGWRYSGTTVGNLTAVVSGSNYGGSLRLKDYQTSFFTQIYPQNGLSAGNSLYLQNTGNVIDTVFTFHDWRTLGGGGGSVVHQNLSNTALLADGDYTHWWNSKRLKIVGFDQFDFLSDTALNGGRYGLSDWKTSKGTYSFSFKDSTAGAYMGPKDSANVLGAFNATSSNEFIQRPDSSYSNKKISYTTNIHSTLGPYSLVTANWVDSMVLKTILDSAILKSQSVPLDTTSRCDGCVIYYDSLMNMHRYKPEAGGTTIQYLSSPPDTDSIYFNTTTHKLGIRNGLGTYWLYFTPSDSSAISGGSTTLVDDLLAHWDLDEASGDRADSHGSYTLTDNGSVGSTTGKIDDAADYPSGAAFKYLSNSNACVLGTGFAYNFWVKIPSGTTGTHILFNRGESGDLEMGCFFDGTQLRFYTSSDGTSQTFIDFASGIADGNWHMITILGSSGDGIYIFKDNASAGTGSWVARSGTSNVFRLGNWQGATDNSVQMIGALDHFDWWNRQLTIGEINMLWNGGSGLPYSSY